MNTVFIIAEAGVNHNGNIEIAKKLIDEASLVGADAIKFQTFRAEKLVTKYANKAEYQSKSTNKSESQYDMLKKLELSYDNHVELKRYSDKKKIVFLSSPFDIESIYMLNDMGMEIFKIPSGEITNYPYLKNIGKLNKKIILSTGMSTLGEIELALDILETNGTKDISILHCNTEYPTPMKDVNLNAMLTIKEAFKYEVGYSDHTLGIEVPIAAVALGAKIIEKHFTLNKNLDGPDHKASLNPEEFKNMVMAIRNVEISLGDGKKKPTESEFKNKNMARKSIVAKNEIREGEVFTDSNLDIKRPGNGISPMRWKELMGRRAIRSFKKDELIEI